MRLGWMGERVREREKNVLCHHNQLEMMRFLIFFFGWLAGSNTYTHASTLERIAFWIDAVNRTVQFIFYTHIFYFIFSLSLSISWFCSITCSLYNMLMQGDEYSRTMQLLCLKLQQTCLFFTSGWMKMVCVCVYSDDDRPSRLLMTMVLGSSIESLDIKLTSAFQRKIHAKFMPVFFSVFLFKSDKNVEYFNVGMVDEIF